MAAQTKGHGRYLSDFIFLSRLSLFFMKSSYILLLQSSATGVVTNFFGFLMLIEGQQFSRNPPIYSTILGQLRHPVLYTE